MCIAESELMAIEEVAPHPKEYVVRYGEHKPDSQGASLRLVLPEIELKEPCEVRVRIVFV